MNDPNDAAAMSELVDRARELVPGGAQTGLRPQAYDTGDVAFDSASDATLTTVSGERYTDYHLGFGPIVLGHAHDGVDEAARAAIDDGVLYGAGTTPLEVEVAERLVDLVPLGLDEASFRAFAAGMRERGQFFTPNPYKRHHLSFAHDESHLEPYLDAADAILAEL